MSKQLSLFDGNEEFIDDDETLAEEMDDFIASMFEPDSEKEDKLASEPLFSTLLRRAVEKIWDDTPVMTDLVTMVMPPLSTMLADKAAKGGNFAKDKQALGIDTSRYEFDQSMRAHLVNGLFPVLHIAKILTRWGGVPILRDYTELTQRLFIAGFILHDWLKLPEVEETLKAAGFSHDDSVGIEQLPLIETLFVEWCDKLHLTPFLEPVGGIHKLLHDLIYIACNTQIRWGTLSNFNILSLDDDLSVERELSATLCRLADYLTYIARKPRDVAFDRVKVKSSNKATADRTIHQVITQLSGQQAQLTYHHLADNLGMLTNFIHNSVLNAMRHDDYRVPILYAPSGVVYLTRVDAPMPPNISDIADKVIEEIKDKVKRQLFKTRDGFNRDGKGMKFAPYYRLFFDTANLIRLGSRATLDIIHPKKKPSAGKRFAKMEDKAWLSASVKLDLSDDFRVDQLAEWCYLAEKTVVTHYPKFETVNFLLKELGLFHMKADFEAVPRDNRAGGVGYHWYLVAGHYFETHGHLDPVAWGEQIEQLAKKLIMALPDLEQDDSEDETWQDLRAYINQVLTISEANTPQLNRVDFITQLEHYQNAKRKGRGKTAVCAIRPSSFGVNKQKEAAVLFAPQVYSNRLTLHGSDAVRNISSICSLEMMLRQLLMNKTKASGKNFEGRRMRYLYFYPTYFFTPETLEILREVQNQIDKPSFTELRRQLIKGKGLNTRIDMTPETLQRLEPLLLRPIDETRRDGWMRYTELDTATFGFLGVPPRRDAKDAESWVHPAFLALLLPLCLDVKVVASESSLPIMVEADELPETVLLDAPHTFVRYITQSSSNVDKFSETSKVNAPLAEQPRFNIDQLLPTLQKLIISYLIQLDANSSMGRTGFDYRWQDIPAVARNLADTPLYAFHYLKKWQRKQKLDTLPIGKAVLYLDFLNNYLVSTERSLSMNHARELTRLYRQFYRAKTSKPNSILRPLAIATQAILAADPRLFGTEAAMEDMVFGTIRRRITKLWQENLAFPPPKDEQPESLEQAMRDFAAYLVHTIYFEALRGDTSALRGKQLNLLSNACEGIYREEQAKYWKQKNQQ